MYHHLPNAHRACHELWVGRPSRSQSHKFDGLFVVVIVFPFLNGQLGHPPIFRHMNLSIVSGIGELNPPKRVWIAELDEVNIYCTIFPVYPHIQWQKGSFKCPPKSCCIISCQPRTKGLENPIFLFLMDFDARHCLRRNGQQLMKDYQKLLEAKKQHSTAEGELSGCLRGRVEWDCFVFIICLWMFMDVHGI